MSMKELETRGFQSEVKQLLHLMIHSLYSNKEIFLRELISNASDAADRLRFCALSQPNLYEDDTDLHICIHYDKEKRIITVSDNGIGMSRDQVIDNLGTIAKSGTKTFLESMNPEQIKNSNIIGQFGVGFYSAFIVASKVIVRTRAAGISIEKGVFWESIGEGSYTIANIIKRDRGTEITLYLRENEDEFLDDWKLKSIIKKYSDHIALPIKLKVHTHSTDPTHSTKKTEWEQVNKAKALWIQNKADISDEEYKEFYKYLSHDFNDPLIWSHNHVEGKQEYISLLYVPSKAPWDLWNREYKYGLKLYVQRVFIMEHMEQFLPNYLRFIKGLIDSSDLPLNISRELLQDNRIIQNLKGTLTKRVLLMLEKLSKDNAEKYQLFWNEFGLILKEGLGEDPENKNTISTLLRFSSTYNKSSEQTISLEKYIERMINNQEKIYYITADNYITARYSPHLEIFDKNGVEVLLLYDRIDEWMMNYLTEFSGKTFQSISKIDSTLEKWMVTEQHEKNNNTEILLESLIHRIKNYLGERIKDVRFTNRLTDTPVVVVTDINDMTTQMAKLLSTAGQKVPDVKYILELNPKHAFIQHINQITDDNKFHEWIDLLLDQALLVERGMLDNPAQFIRRMNHLLLS